MYRPRSEVPGAYYHVVARGNNKEPIYLGDDDRLTFLAMLARIARRHEWSVQAYCLMTNHYHLILQLGHAGVSRGMCQLNGGYAYAFNDRHHRSNHLFGRRFWDTMIDRDSHLVEACRYVVLNPVRADLTDDPGTWRWSSYRACAGLDLPPPFLSLGEILGLFGRTPEAAQAAYREYVSEGHVRRQPP